MDIAAECQRLQGSIEEAVAEFHQDADVNHFLLCLRTLLMAFIENLVLAQIQQYLESPDFIAGLKVQAAKAALRFSGFLSTSETGPSGIGTG